jgi:two-component system response regulator
MRPDAAGTILLVEDNPDDVELTMRALRQHSIRNEIIVARDGVEALDHLLAGRDQPGDDRTLQPRTPGPGGRSELPVLVLLDLNLPRINGLEVLETIRASPRTALLPVVVLTSSREDQDVIASYRFGANSYVRKPVEFAAFSAAVRELGVYWLLINQAPPTQ